MAAGPDFPHLFASARNHLLFLSSWSLHGHGPSAHTSVPSWYQEAAKHPDLGIILNTAGTNAGSGSQNTFGWE